MVPASGTPARAHRRPAPARPAAPRPRPRHSPARRPADLAERRRGAGGRRRPRRSTGWPAPTGRRRRARAGRARPAGRRTGVGLRLADALRPARRPRHPADARRGRRRAGPARPRRHRSDFGVRLASWLDRPPPGARRTCAASSPACSPSPAACCRPAAPPSTRCSTGSRRWPTRSSCDRLPALRGGFDALSPAARERLLDTCDERLGDGHDVGLVDAPHLLLAAARVADRAGLAALAAHGLTRRRRPTVDDAQNHRGRADTPTAGASRGAPARCPTAGGWSWAGRASAWPRVGRRFATALDELYGAGQGRGLPGRRRRAGGGREARVPRRAASGPRSWPTLFGAGGTRGGARPAAADRPGGRRAAARPDVGAALGRTAADRAVAGRRAARGDSWRGCARWSPGSSRS